jgi:hypothetical protein
MRGKRCAGLGILMLAAALYVGPAAAEDAPASTPTAANERPGAMIVLDASRTMWTKIGGLSKNANVRIKLGEVIGTYDAKLSFGLVAFGHRQTSNCADTETVAKLGELSKTSQKKLLDRIKPKGQAPVAAAIAEAAKDVPKDGNLDIVFIGDGGDTCNADICAATTSLKEKTPGLRIHVIGIDTKGEAELKPLACMATATGGQFVAATNADTLKKGLATVFDAALTPRPAEPTAPVAAAPPAAATQAPHSAPATPSAQPVPPAGNVPANQQAAAPPSQTAPAQTEAPTAPSPEQQSASAKEDAPAAAEAPGEKAAPAEAATAPPPEPPIEPGPPVPVSFKALLTESGPKLDAGLVWRVFSEDEANSPRKLLSTHREATPTAALEPGNYLVNAAYGLSNLTKKIKVRGGRSIEETFILNTGALKLAAETATGERLPQGAVRFDILSDDEDQFGNRRKILGNAPPELVIRLNAGAYHIVSQYGDANASVRADVTVEPGKITEATVKHAAATVTFKLVQGLGGEALTDTQWNVLTPTGDSVKKIAGALPTHILAAGSYAVVATHSGLTYTRKFNVEPGMSKQVEVVVEDGPTSPEALKAILEPSVPPPGAGTFAGGADAPDGGAALGFAPEPTGPLINPSVLFRPPVRP